MYLVKIRVSNFRGIQSPVEIKCDLLNIIIGRNDSGKSTILKALDLFLNDSSFLPDYRNIKSNTPLVEIVLFLKPNKTNIIIDESIETTFEDEELLNENDLVQIKKTWDTSKTSRISSELFIKRKKYSDDDFIDFSEKQLLDLCKKKNIETAKAYGEEYNNVEKRAKLRALYKIRKVTSEYCYDKLPTSGNSRMKNIGSQLKQVLPRFEYFKADTSLSETDTAIQNFFKEIAKKTFHEELDLVNIEDIVRKKLNSVLSSITDKINKVVPKDESIESKVEFDWTRIVKTTFNSKNDDGDLPLGSRGDGFRRITMMSYFEYLAEQNISAKQNIIFGFEEPETFLHPSAQENIFNKFLDLCSNQYQIFVTTHSPIIVSLTHKDDLSHVSKVSGEFNIDQKINTLNEIAEDIGITVDNQFITLFEKAKAIIFVEGADDAKALNHISKVYKAKKIVPEDFDSLGIIVIPTGGCGSIKHWVTFELINKLNREFVIFQDSDVNDEFETSKNKILLETLGFKENIDFVLTKKRELENYIPPTYLNRVCPGANIYYDDFNHVKEICKRNPFRENLNCEKVLDAHFCNLGFEELRSTFNNGIEDEFVNLYNLITSKLK